MKKILLVIAIAVCVSKMAYSQQYIYLSEDGIRRFL